MKHMGKRKDLRRESQRIVRVIEEAFEKIDPGMWFSDSRLILNTIAASGAAEEH
jgi:hypothetical protein